MFGANWFGGPYFGQGPMGIVPPQEPRTIPQILGIGLAHLDLCAVAVPNEEVVGVGVAHQDLMGVGDAN